MSRPTLSDLVEATRTADAPAIVPALPMTMGGVDPLGLRQLNFMLMDQALPGCNNVATRLRPYIFLAWAWWKAGKAAERLGLEHVSDDQLRDFVDRADVAFSASHLQVGEFDGLLGSQVLERYRGGAESYAFGSGAWRDFRRNRANNTALMAPVAYGPSIRVGPGLGLLQEVSLGSVALWPTVAAMPAVAAFEAALGELAGHPLFTSFDPLTVSRADLHAWHPLWRIADVSEPERRVGRAQLYNGHQTGAGRQRLLAAIEARLTEARKPQTVDEVRARLVGEAAEPSGEDAGEIWRALQARQLFRLSLESLLVWVLRTLGARVLPLEAIATRLLEELGLDGTSPFADWLAGAPRGAGGALENPVALMNRAVAARRDPSWLQVTINGLRLSLAVADQRRGMSLYGGMRERLPLEAALTRGDDLAGGSLRDGVEAILAEWIVGQHLYWAIGRSGDDTQRLRLMLEEGGWSALLTRPSFPNPTPDRLAAVLSLMADCGVIERCEGDAYRARIH